jgi:hypothetical protein
MIYFSLAAGRTRRSEVISTTGQTTIDFKKGGSLFHQEMTAFPSTVVLDTLPLRTRSIGSRLDSREG